MNDTAKDDIDEKDAEPPREGKVPWTRRERALICVAALGVLLGIVGVCLFALTQPPAGSAAKVGDFYISEAEVSAQVAEQRARDQQKDDSAFAEALLKSGLNPGTYRQSAINQLALNGLLNRKAADLGVTPNDDEVQKQIDAMKAATSFNDDGIWAETLEMYATSEERLRSQFATNLAEKAVYEKEVPREDATDEQVVEYIANNRSETTDVHSWRIVFKGDDGWDRAQECWKRIEAAGEDLDADAFSGFALAYSDEEGVQDNGGEYGWSGSWSGASSDYLDVLSNLKKGGLSGPVTIEDEEATEIIYLDETYTYPSKEKCKKLNLKKLPAGLAEQVRKAASDELWSSSCNVYLANMLGQAKITYYPMPDDAAYNIDLVQALGGESGDDAKQE